MNRIRTGRCTCTALSLLLIAGAARAQQMPRPTSMPASDTSAAATQNLSTSVTSQAIVPQLIKFNGEVRDASGKPITGTSDVTFAIYSQQEGGEPLWFETQTVGLDSLGRYTVLLGAMRGGVPLDLFTSGEARWLGVQVGNGPEQPRVLLLSVPYALKAADAETLGGRPLSDFMLKDSSNTASAASSTTKSGKGTSGVKAQSTTTTKSSTNATGTTPVTTAGGTVNYVPLWDSTSDITSSVIFQNGTNVGVGTTTPGGALDVRSNATTPALQVIQSGTGFAVNVQGTIFGSTTGTNTAFQMRTNGVANAIQGNAAATSGVTIGVAGTSHSTAGTGVYGDAQGASGTVYGVFGRDLTSTSGIGVYGIAVPTSGTTVGVYGVVNSATGTAAHFDNTAGGTILAGYNNGVQKFLVDGSGNATAAGTVTGTQLVSTVATGIAPLSVTSTTVVPNLNAASAMSASGLSCKGCVTTTQIGSGTVASGQVLTADGSGGTSWVVAGPNGQAEFGQGTAMFTVPAGVTRIRAFIYGAGGGAGASSGDCSTSCSIGGSGGTGASAEGVIGVTPGETLTIIVGGGGAGGTYGTTNSGGSGGSTEIEGPSSLVLISAGGGGGGTCGSCGAATGSGGATGVGPTGSLLHTGPAGSDCNSNGCHGYIPLSLANTDYSIGRGGFNNGTASETETIDGVEGYVYIEW
jgi:hypothetical protein